MKKKSPVLRALPWVLLAAVIGGILYLGYLLWGRPEAEPRYTAGVVRYEEENPAQIVLDNGKLHFEMDPATTHFTLTDAYGHTWKSNPFSDPEKSGETVASGENRSALASTLNVYYRLPKKAIDNMYDNYTYSISRSAYEIRVVDDTTVAVTYAVGDIAREYLIPEALTKARYEELGDLVKASGNSKKKFTGKFSPQKQDSVLKNAASSKQDEKEAALALIASYPQISGQDVYVTTAKDNNNMEALARLLAETGYTEDDQKLDIILTRSSYTYTYEKVTAEEFAALRDGELADQAERLLAADPALAEKGGYLLRRSSRTMTPGMIEKLQAGDEELAALAETLSAAYPQIGSDPFTVIELEETEKSRVYTIPEILDEESYGPADRALETSLFEAAEKSVDVLFNVTVYYRLDGEDFIAEVPYGEISFNSANASMSYISVLPMFGAVGAGEDGTYEEGYLLVPEGGGSLIAFNNRKFSYTGYYADVYGYDYGIKRTEVIAESKASFPVFGILRPEQSFMCVVENGSAFVSIQADINGVTAGTGRSSYNYVNAKSQILHVDQYNVSAKTAELQLMYEREIPENTLTQRYRFTDGGDYVPLAASYGDYLRGRHPELKDRKASEDVPVSLELIGAIDKKMVIAGLPVRKTFATTTFAQGGEILRKLLEGGARNLSARYTGWLKGGVRQKALTGVSVLGELGGAAGMKKLISEAKESGVPLYFDGITAFVYDSGLTDGFLASRDAARHITREVAQIPPYSPIYYTEDPEREGYYLVHPDFAQKNAGRLITWLKDAGAQGVTFRDIGVMLSADYDPNCVRSRETVKAMNIRTLADAREAGEAVMIKNGFDFTLPYADIVTDMDLSGNRYMILDRHIPFYQIAIHGMVDYTGKPLNLEGDYQTELLRSVEYGAGLNFSFIAENASVTQETNYTGLYGASFSSWEEEAKEIILRYQREAAGLNSQRIVGHGQLSETLTVTEFEDGTRVYVNYGTEDSTGEVSVPARDYLVVREEGK